MDGITVLQRHRLLVAIVLCSLAGCQMGPLSDRLGLASGRVGPHHQQGMGEELAAAATLERERQTDLAISTYAQIIAYAPNCPRAQHRLAVLYSQQGRFEDAER